MKRTFLILALLAQPAFAADPRPVSFPTVVGPEQDADSDHAKAYATVALTTAVIIGAIIYASKDRQALDLKPTRTRTMRVYVDQKARIGVAFDL